MAKAIPNINNLEPLKQNRELVQKELQYVDQLKKNHLLSQAQGAAPLRTLPEDIVDINFQRVEKDKGIIPNQLTYSKPATAGLPLLTILEGTFRKGEDIKLVPSTINILETVLSSPETTKADKEMATYIIKAAAANGQEIPQSLKNLGETTAYTFEPSSTTPQTNKFISILAEGFKDGQAGVSKFTDSTLNQLRTVLTDPTANATVKQEAKFIISEALKHVGSENTPELTVPADLVKLADINPSKQTESSSSIDPYKILTSLAHKFENNINVKLTPKTVALLESALKDPTAPTQAKQDAATIIIEAYGKPDQNLITNDLVRLAQEANS